MKVKAIREYLSNFREDDYLPIVWWTKKDVMTWLELDYLDAKDWFHIVNEWEADTAGEVQSIADQLMLVSREVLNI